MSAYSIPHQYCSDYYSTFFTEFCSLPTCDETSNMLNNNNNYMAPLMNYDISSPVSVASFPHEQFGVNSDSSMCMSVPQMSEIEMGFSSFAVCDYQQYDQVFEPGDQECIINGMVPKYWPAYNTNNPMAAENWTLQGSPAVITKVEETEVKVGRYSAEEKKDRILRYLKKRNQRNFNKTIKYACRKTLADKRVRIRGRFAKNNEPCPCDEEIVINTIPHTSYEQNNLSFQDSFQMKYDEDCWLQAAMSNLMHLPSC